MNYATTSDDIISIVLLSANLIQHCSFYRCSGEFSGEEVRAGTPVSPHAGLSLLTLPTQHQVS